jgi:hypothetical protein
MPGAYRIHPPAVPGACYRYATCFRFRLTFFGTAPRKSDTPSIEAAAAQPTRQSSQWLSTALALSFHSSTVRPRASVEHWQEIEEAEDQIKRLRTELGL